MYFFNIYGYILDKYFLCVVFLVYFLNFVNSQEINPHGIKACNSCIQSYDVRTAAAVKALSELAICATKRR